jgi:hypothetical protein
MTGAHTWRCWCQKPPFQNLNSSISLLLSQKGVYAYGAPCRGGREVTADVLGQAQCW